MAEIIAIVVVIVLLISIGIFLLTGHSSVSNKGYNTRQKEEKAEYNANALSRFIRGILNRFTKDGDTSESRSDGDVHELTFSLSTHFKDYKNHELTALLFEELINGLNPDVWDFLVLEPSKAIQDITLIQVGAPDEKSNFQYRLNIIIDNDETGQNMYYFYTEDKNVVLQFFVDYWQDHKIPDISSWEEQT